MAVALALGRSGASRDHEPAPQGAGHARVQRVVDGDTVRLVGLGSVRLIGIDTPEVYGHAECYGSEASAFTGRVLAPGSGVRYRLGAETHDRYGRALAYVWLRDGRMFNRMLVRGGYATVLTIPPNDRFAPTFRADERRARAARAGSWRAAGCL